MFSPVILALTEATTGRPAQLSAQLSPLRSSSTTMIRASAPRTTLDCTSLVQALRAFTTVLDLLLADHPEVLFHVSYLDRFAPVLSFMSNCMNGLEPIALAHFVEVLFFNVFQNVFYALAPDTGLTETKQKVQAVISAAVAATRRPGFAVT